MDAAPGVGGLLGHVSPKFKLPGMRDTDNVNVFFAELDEYEKNFNSDNPNKRLPNFIVMSLPEDHTAGTRPGGYHAEGNGRERRLGCRPAGRAHVKESLLAGDRDLHDRGRRPERAGPRRRRRTVGLVASPYTKRDFVDSTLYSTSSMLRTIELLLGLPPMTQYDAAAMPMYNAFRQNAGSRRLRGGRAEDRRQREEHGARLGREGIDEDEPR